LVIFTVTAAIFAVVVIVAAVPLLTEFSITDFGSVTASSAAYIRSTASCDSRRDKARNSVNMWLKVAVWKAIHHIIITTANLATAHIDIIRSLTIAACTVKYQYTAGRFGWTAGFNFTSL